MRVLVTGGAGFIGQHLVYRLREEGHEVVVFDVKSYAAIGWNRVSRVAKMVCGDVCDPAMVRNSVRRVDMVFHLAAESHVDRSLDDPGLAMKTNALGTAVVADACVKHDVPLVYCSTDEVYGDTAHLGRKAVETDPLNPSSPYSAGKAAGEMYVHAACRSFGLKAVITRGCNAFGPHQYPEKLVPIACRMISQGKKVHLHGGGWQVRQWVHVFDFVDALYLAGFGSGFFEFDGADSPRIYNIAGPRRSTVRSLVYWLAMEKDDKLSEDDVSESTVDRPGQDKMYGVSGARMEEVFGFTPKRDIMEPGELQLLLRHYSKSQDIELAHWVEGASA